MPTENEELNMSETQVTTGKRRIRGEVVRSPTEMHYTDIGDAICNTFILVKTKSALHVPQSLPGLITIGISCSGS